jgi:hypothetical protein
MSKNIGSIAPSECVITSTWAMAGTSATLSTLPKPFITSKKILATNVSLIVVYVSFH